MSEPTDDNITHMILALGGEVGELANVWKKYLRGSIGRIQALELISAEWADVLTYAMNIPPLCDFDPQEVYDDKRDFNQRRFGPDDD